MRGYFGIGIYQGKTAENIGTLWRSAYQLGAAFIFVIGKRYHKMKSDTTKASRHIPLYEYETWDEFKKNGIPDDCPIVAIEMGGHTIVNYVHPERCIYLLGAEDSGLPASIIEDASALISLPTVRSESYNVAVAGSIVMFDRLQKAVLNG